jgi:hypothetical protein
MPKKSTKSLLTPAEKSARLQQAMYRLVGNDAFTDFVEEIRELQRNAMIDAISDLVVKDDRLTTAALGEIRAYEAIAGLYEDFLQQHAQRAEIEAEQRGS